MKTIPVLTLLVTLSQALAGSDEFSSPAALGAGNAHDLAIDSQRRRLHLVYLDVDDAALFYRTGTVDGSFGKPELVARARPGKQLCYPRIALDSRGTPHVVMGEGKDNRRDAAARAELSLYSNRLPGHWKPASTVFSAEEEKAPWVNFPTLAIDDDGTVFIGTKTYSPVLSKLARLEDAATTPRVAAKADLHIGALNLFTLDGKLLALGGHKGTWHATTIDKDRLAPLGEPLLIARGEFSEQMRAYADGTGDVHIAFGPHSAGSSPGFYHTISRVQKNLPPIRYATTNTHHSGNGRVVRDARHPDRVYVFHWSGAAGDKHGVYNQFCVPDNRVHFVRIENGRKMSELRPITDRPGSHGASYRNQPSAVAHPDGGAIVVFTECSPDGARGLWLTTIGERKPAR
ncbi:MAG: hypothetical protein ACREIA_22400 [Opitutaceae bacterium]